ncbi:hypothetical protein HY971_02980 [Candidatus Kaiserbacteria bacterium]|nr:hypothetical protein [Candidatus Kaiserbacteria bacterium]
MRADKKAATTMRREGKSYSEILKALKIPKATLSGWFGKANWSQGVRKRLAKTATTLSTERLRELNQIRGNNLKNAYDEARREAREEFIELKYNPLFIAGLMLYWGEGDKVTRHNTRLTNTDPEMIRLFVFFLTRACRIPRKQIKASVLVYPDLNAAECLTYWSRNSALDKNSFTKCIRISGRHKTKRLPNGVCIIVVSSSYFKTKILEWMSLLPKELMDRKYYASM